MQDPATILEGILAKAEEAEAASADAAVAPVDDAPAVADATPPGETDSAAPSEETGQPASEVGGLLDLLDAAEQAVPGPTIGSPEWYGQQVAVPIGDSTQPVAISELVQGYMRQADYTRKTQDVAEQKGAVKRAVDFYDEFQDDPEAFGRKIAVAAGWIAEDQGKVAEVPEIVSQGDVERLVQEGVASTLAEHPDVLAAQQGNAERQMDSAFAGIETKWGVELDGANRERVLIKAQASGTTDLDMVFNSMMLEAAQIAQQRNAVKATAPAKPGTTPTVETDQTPEFFDSLEDAWKAMEMKLGDSADLI